MAPVAHDLPTFLPPGRADAQTFATAEALARHVHQLRNGRRIDLLEQSCTRNGEPYFAVVAIFANGPGQASDWLGWTAGPGADRIGDVLAALQATRPSPVKAPPPPPPAQGPSTPADLFNATTKAA